MRQTEQQPPASDSLSTEARFIEIPCLICGVGEVDIVASAADLEAQARFLQKFHHHRKRMNGAGLADRAEFTQDYHTRIVACRSCGFVFRSPRPTVSAVLGAYVKDRYNEAHLQSEFLSQQEWAEKKAAVLARWAQFQKQAPMIVEVGSFVGGFLDAGRRRGWSLLGIDPGKEVTEFCQAQGLPVYCGTLAEAPIRPGSVDAVVIWNTFDQLPNPDTTLAAARRVLRDEGLLIIRVPNGLMYHRGVRFLNRRGLLRKWMITTLAWNNLLGFPYLHGYSVTTMDQLLGRHGFNRLKVDRDTLVTLSNSDTKAWARAEETFTKWVCRWLAGVESLWESGATSLAPWLDVYYGIGGVMAGTPVSVPTKLE